MSEQLFSEREQQHPTPHEKVLMAQGINYWSSQELSAHLQELRELVEKGTSEQIQHKLKDIVPSYRPH